ncbi:MAG TPA: trypsin-like peptidase domain-containing protein [Gemmataceae bacterium]|nr:trypsin-like peptidase domain-containing protein [Gemmataceae bacterium]
MRSPRSSPGILLAFTPAVLGLALGLAAPTAATDRGIAPGKRRDEVVDIYERVKGSVVNIHSERTVSTPPEDPFNRAPVVPQRVNGMGTGIVLDPRGYVLTNFHVVDDVNSLRVRLYDGSGYTARVIATDKDADVALIKIDPTRPLPTIPFGTSSDLMIGEPVIAIGNAFGYEHTVTDGRVSFKGRDVSLNKEVSYKGLIQTSAPINPGNSGGPLLNVLGEVVGVNVAIRAGAQNIGFALPIDFVIARAAELIGPRRRAGLRHGLLVKDNAVRESAERPLARSVTIETVEADSPAAAAGFQVGDVVEQVDDIAVRTSIDFERAFLEKSAGAKVAVKVSRNGTAISAELGLQMVMKPAATPTDVVWRRLGLKLQAVGPDVVAKANPQLHGGMLVTDVAPGSAAATAGILKGDILVGLHQYETISYENVAFVINHKDLASFLPLKFYVARDGKLRDGWITGVP